MLSSHHSSRLPRPPHTLLSRHLKLSSSTLHTPSSAAVTRPPQASPHTLMKRILMKRIQKGPVRDISLKI
ncbi:hypothetical protein LINPERHAP1_LOCUS29536 [Linum perenne]